MKISDKLKHAHDQHRLSYSFEYFPPKTEAGLANLFDRMGRMARCEPDFISCTWGAGGSTQGRTLEVCSTAQSVYGLETLMHLTCTNMGKDKIDRALKDAKDAGMQNILALRGDAPRDQEYWTPVDPGFTHASDLVSYIRQQYGDYFCIGVAGYPEGHMDTPDKAQDLQYLKAKVDCGADFIMTQLFYNVDTFKEWVKSCRAIGIHVPIVPSIMPIPTYQSFRRIINLCSVQVPKPILDALDAIKADDQKVKDYGVDLAVDMIRQIRDGGCGISGIHISTLNLERSAKLILEKLGVAPKQAPPAAAAPVTDSNKGFAPWSAIRDPAHMENWDEFPNGRYGDARSPAFGENTYGASLPLPTSKAAAKWGHPTTPDDITRLFEKYILGQLNSLPWCEEPLQTETETIQQQLIQINRNRYWTVGSQPAVNGAPSGDAVYGWGPANGYVYQKAFLECFVSDKQLPALLDRLKADPFVTFYAANRKGDFVTNVENAEAQNAVTWGVFPGKEIVQPTIIERVSFESWKRPMDYGQIGSSSMHRIARPHSC
ncbi:methylenetetrahydrofolate reductase-domain-containing protein [Zychaea mexicana]|uniref:methylenetetrahydrofolate reductase-domain-containing protein n=1 Tax=Zychaea mexicana TaxID=64656 RepID=UPI0022FDDA64|nr:methylenetetrahydrofolate reductase-domain-containing protein [Zychaea mexicana]KAI9497312.1 methylenetetrahydrofolate reductase-domain-containing protein [Zychaea mexicana]